MIRTLGNTVTPLDLVVDQITAAGGKPANCTTQRVYLPFTDPNSGLNYYETSQCSRPGDPNTYDAALIAANPNVYFTEVNNGYKPNPVVGIPTNTAQATPTPTFTTTTPAPATTPISIIGQPIQPPAPAYNPAGTNSYDPGAIPIYISGGPTANPTTGTAPTAPGVNVQISQPATTPASSTDSSSAEGFWQSPAVQNIANAASGLPWWVYVVAAVVVYKTMQKGGR